MTSSEKNLIVRLKINLITVLNNYNNSPSKNYNCNMKRKRKKNKNNISMI